MTSTSLDSRPNFRFYIGPSEKLGLVIVACACAKSSSDSDECILTYTFPCHETWKNGRVAD